VPSIPPREERTTRDYARKLFFNAYNFSLLGGCGVTALLTGDWWLGLVGIGAEALFMLYAPDSTTVRLLVDKVLDKEALEEVAKKREATLRMLARPDQIRCQALMTKKFEIAKLAADNPTFGAELLRGEIAKLDKLVDSFIDLASTTARYREYLDKEDVGEIERMARSYEREAKETNSELAQKNLAICRSRIDRLKDIREFIDRAFGQLELIENSFGLLADQIVSMRSPGELSGQLDDLIDGVEAVRQTAAEEARLLGSSSTELH